MKFMRYKCKVLHLSNQNQSYKCYMGGNWLSSTTYEKDLGVLVDHNFNIIQQCDVVKKKKANTILSCISRKVVSRSCKILVPLENALVRPHLKYCVHFWAPV